MRIKFRHGGFWIYIIISETVLFHCQLWLCRQIKFSLFYGIFMATKILKVGMVAIFHDYFKADMCVRSEQTVVCSVKRIYAEYVFSTLFHIVYLWVVINMLVGVYYIVIMKFIDLQPKCLLLLYRQRYILGKYI